MNDPRPAAAEPELRTTRLSLRRPVEGDIGAIFAIHRDPETCRHNPGDALGRFTEAEALYRRWNDQWERYGYGYWTVRQHGSDRPLGFCGVKVMELHGTNVLNLFYRFATSAWGQGFAGEAATAVTAWVSLNVPDRTLIARIRPANIASHRVAVRAGLTRAPHLDGPGHDGFDRIYAKEQPQPEPSPSPAP
ncbi:GNAT family N-acetyltransferase [Streptomyces sp. G44]|uniref:GNAT family N-acetyltransferase n=1 Tax=Streptomyces sp. G44 TaxID=2807632 RepID=UPI0019611329|nr:GNAT family N-acetyltransferase [Streptomyces sp. G44]MBM7171218.1 GNAT family N-acetyltransferase [Streptomyces sp. G44]